MQKLCAKRGTKMKGYNKKGKLGKLLFSLTIISRTIPDKKQLLLEAIGAHKQ